MRNAIWAALSLGVLLQSVAPASAQEPGRLPRTAIPIEASDYDACSSNGIVHGLDPAGDGFLSVRTSPGAGRQELDRLYNGEEVFICASDGNWLGIVYTKQGQECNVNSPWRRSQPYTGPCRSGWVHRNWVLVTAG